MSWILDNVYYYLGYSEECPQPTCQHLKCRNLMLRQIRESKSKLRLKPVNLTTGNYIEEIIVCNPKPKKIKKKKLIIKCLSDS